MRILTHFGFIKLLVLLTLSFIFLSGCEKENPNDEIVSFVWNYALDHPDGFTLDINYKEPVLQGIVASYLETQNSFGKESLPKVVDHALKHDGIIGGWQNTENLFFYFDSNKVFPDSCLDEAIAFAKENLQMAIYDLTNDSVIWIEYPKIGSFAQSTHDEIHKTLTESINQN